MLLQPASDFTEKVCNKEVVAILLALGFKHYVCFWQKNE